MTYCAAVSSLGGIFCVGQIVCEALGSWRLNKGTAAPDFCDLRAAFPDDTADDLVGDGHLVGLVGVCPAAASASCWRTIFIQKCHFYSDAPAPVYFGKVKVCLGWKSWVSAVCQ